MSTITSITPINNPDQRIIKVDNQTSDIVLMQIGGIIYINSSSESHLQEIAKRIGIKNPECINIRGKERQYGGISGHLLKTTYKSLPGSFSSIKTLLSKSTISNGVLHKKAA